MLLQFVLCTCIQIAEKKRRDAEAKAREREAEVQAENKARAYLQARGADGARGEGRRRFRAIGNPVAVSPPASPSVSPTTSPPPPLSHAQRSQHMQHATPPGQHSGGAHQVDAHGRPIYGGTGVMHVVHALDTPSPGMHHGGAGHHRAHAVHNRVAGGNRPVHTGHAFGSPMHAEFPESHRNHNQATGDFGMHDAYAHAPHMQAGQQRIAPGGSPPMVAQVKGGVEEGAVEEARGSRGSRGSREGSSQQRQALVELLREVQGEQRRMREQFEETSRRLGEASGAAAPSRAAPVSVRAFLRHFPYMSTLVFPIISAILWHAD